MRGKWLISVLFTFVLSQAWSLAGDQIVKITPLGSKTGDFCAQDRAMLFEDPTGVRILYDPGRTVAGGADSRLGDVHVVLLSHVHVDHLGDVKMNQDPDSDTARCDGGFPTLPAVPNSNTADIAATKNSAVLASSDIAAFLGRKIQDIRGQATPGCPASGLTNEMVVPRDVPCTGGIGFGAKRTVTVAAGTPGVLVTTVPAQHGNLLSNSFLNDPLKGLLNAESVSLAIGSATGFVLTFTNGLRVYLSGDTGQTSDMSIIRELYHPNLTVFNIGDIFTTGPEEAAFAVTRLVQPNAAIPSHANEVATTNGVVNPGTRTARFIELSSDVPVLVPLSGLTMEFNGRAECVTGCGEKPRGAATLRKR